MGMIRRGRKRLGATRDSLRSQAGVGKETLGGCRECHGETPRHERLFEVTEVGADVRFEERDGLHRRRRFMSDVGGRAGAARTYRGPSLTYSSNRRSALRHKRPVRMSRVQLPLSTSKQNSTRTLEHVREVTNPEMQRGLIQICTST